MALVSSWRPGLLITLLVVVAIGLVEFAPVLAPHSTNAGPDSIGGVVTRSA